MAASTRPRVEAFTPAPSLRTADTVAFDTPAWWATSVIVGRLVVIATGLRGGRRPNGREPVRTGSKPQRRDDSTGRANGCQARTAYERRPPARCASSRTTP